MWVGSCCSVCAPLCFVRRECWILLLPAWYACLLPAWYACLHGMPTASMPASLSRFPDVPALLHPPSCSGAVAGKLASGAASWVPASYVQSQQDAVRRFFQQNGHIGYDTVRAGWVFQEWREESGMGGRMAAVAELPPSLDAPLNSPTNHWCHPKPPTKPHPIPPCPPKPQVKQYGIPNARAFLAQHFPDGLALESAYVSPAVVDQVEATVEEALAGGGWCDVLPHVPSILSTADATTLLAQCKAVGGGAAGQAPRVLAGTCVVATAMLEAIQQQLLEAARKAADDAHKQRRAGGGGGAAPAPAAKAAEGGKKAAAGAAATAESDEDDWDMGGKKGKKGKGGGKKAKGGGGGGGGKAKGGSSKATSSAALADADSAAGGSVLSVASLAQRVVELHPDTEGAGADGDLPDAIATGALLGNSCSWYHAGGVASLPVCMEFTREGLLELIVIPTPLHTPPPGPLRAAACGGG